MDFPTNITNNQRKNQLEEFFDKNHPVMGDYYELLEKETTLEKLYEELEKLIEQDPDFYDTYILIADILISEEKTEDARTLLYTAYTRALLRIVDSEGNLPKSLPWGWLENRHLIRAIDRWGLELWKQGKIEESLTIFRKLLKSNPNDNIGARFSILALRLGLGHEYEDRFESKNMPDCVDGFKINKWFDKNSKNFPEEFDWWFKTVNNR